MINNINSYNSNFNINSSTSSEIDEIIDAHKKSTTLTDETPSGIKENLYLSSRAQKINAISTEFFNNGAISLNDVSALKERVYQLGLISKQEYAHLTDTELVDSDRRLNTEMSSQTLVSFAGDLIQRLNEASVDNGDTEIISKSLLEFKKALTTAMEIISDVDSVKNAPDFKESLGSTLSLIRETINSDSFEIIPLDDKVGISKIYQALEIVDKIIPKRLSNAKINRYIQVSIR
ncbi:MAG: hypothetical protein HRT51_05820 [Colwellia sp.]|nr:hypothetical protein [Colwellia sp.]